MSAPFGLAKRGVTWQHGFPPTFIIFLSEKASGNAAFVAD